VAASLGDEGVSIHRMRQYDHTGDAAPVLIVTHKTTRTQLDLALDAMSRLDVMTVEPVALRIEQV
jgi:homoserine dehydrogenase